MQVAATVLGIDLEIEEVCPESFALSPRWINTFNPLF